MADLILVHGATYGSWCWNALREELDRLGHRSWAPDLPIEDVGANLQSYLDVVSATAADASPDAIAIGHSMGGRLLPFFARQRPLGGLVFLAAVVPGLTEAQTPEAASHLTRDVKDSIRADAEGRLYYEPEDARTVFFHDCPPDVADAAIARLRHQAMVIHADTRTIDSYPSIPMRYVVCSEDRALNPAYCRAAAREVLGTTAVEFESSHSPFLSRPADLALVLSDLVADMASSRS